MESTPATVTFCENFSKVKMRIPLPLQNLLSTVKEIKTTGTLEEVMDGMQYYIYENHLYDRQNPRVVHCANDPLKDVLGVEEFTLFEIRRLLLKLLIWENRDNIKEMIMEVASQGNKRKAAEELEESKRRCGEHSNSQSPVDSAGASEGCSTPKEEMGSSVKDTSSLTDDLSDSGSSESEGRKFSIFDKIFAIHNSYEVEYEVESDSPSIHSVTDSDSDIEDTVKVAAISSLLNLDSDNDFWADKSSEESDCDIEISDSDKWRCNTCGSMNKPVVRYCLRCWEQRSGWLDAKGERQRPPRPKGKARKKKNNSNAKSKEECEVTTLPASQESELPESQESQPVDYSDLCILCYEKPKNAIVVHGKIGHQLSCYRCARKLLSLNKPCPICRKPIERVIHHVPIS